MPKIEMSLVKATIERLNNVDHRHCSVEQMIALYQQLTIGYSVIAHNFNPGLLLYRGIGYSHKPLFYSQIIYPPPDKAKLNRASLEGEQMFYATSSKRAVFYELNVQKGDKLVVASWVTNSNLFFNNVGYTKKNFSNLGSSRSIIENSFELSEENQFIADYLAEVFCQPIDSDNKELYNKTVAIAKIHLKQVIGKLFFRAILSNREIECGRRQFCY